jgi:hypothetical protein
MYTAACMLLMKELDAREAQDSVLETAVCVLQASAANDICRLEPGGRKRGTREDEAAACFGGSPPPAKAFSPRRSPLACPCVIARQHSER